MNAGPVDHQPLACREGGEYRPACRCGWKASHTTPSRAEALMRAYQHDAEPDTSRNSTRAGASITGRHTTKGGAHMNRALAAGLGMAAMLIAGAGSCATTTTPKASSPAKTVATLPPVSATAKKAATTAPPTTKAAPATLLDVTGNGDKTSEPFTAKGAWHLKYSYDCSSFGQAGNFGVEVNGGDGFTDEGPNVEGTSGSDTNYEPAGGSFSLQVISECNWHIVATG